MLGVFILLSVLSLCLCASILHVPLRQRKSPFVTQRMVDDINSIPGITWKASMNNGPRIQGATIDQIKRLLGVLKNNVTLPKRSFSKKELSTHIPDSFDASTKWPQCSTITRIRDQSACGSCWAVAAAEAISDRYCTMGVNYNLSISAANLLECCWSCGNGCDGGDPLTAWQYWNNVGLYSDVCQPYPFPKCSHHVKSIYPPCPATEYPTPPCTTGCVPGADSTGTLHKGGSAYSLSGVKAFQLELMARGPLEVTFDVYADFVTYTSGVYQHHSNQLLGGHAVKLVGWGSLNGVPYWKIANSWNKYWGMNGYFLILRGKDECGIEDGGSAGVPLY